MHDFQSILTTYQHRYIELLRSYLERYRSFQKTLFTDVSYCLKSNFAKMKSISKYKFTIHDLVAPDYGENMFPTAILSLSCMFD